MRPPPKDEALWVSFPGLMQWLTDAWKLVELCSCKITVISYTGDGATSQAITGAGFKAKYIKILVRPGAEADTEVFEKVDDSWGEYCVAHLFAATHEHYILDNRLISIDDDGFTVDDDGADSHPNKNGITYTALLIG